MPTAAELLSPTERGIIGALLYFEIFSYPLTAAEVVRFANCPDVLPTEIEQKLATLTEQGIIFKNKNFYSTRDEPAWIERRLDCNRRAEATLPTAFQKAKLIGKFPFVRAVMVSGSLSKNCMTADSDIDFFIVTQPGRLWLSRFLLTIYKKIFLLNSHKHFCINYFVDTEHLQIEEQNLFTATEVATLLPVFNPIWHERLQAENRDWVKNFYPNHPPRPTDEVPTEQPNFLKKTLERLLSGSVGNWLDGWAMQITVGFWKRKFSHFDEATFGVALKSRRHVSKHHPLYFQQRVLAAFDKKWEEFLTARGELQVKEMGETEVCV